MLAAPANQSYKLSVYAKCPAGRNAFVYIPGMTNGDVVSYLYLQRRLDPEHGFGSPPERRPYVSYSFYNADTSWLLLDDVVLTFGDGTAPSTWCCIPASAM